MAGPRPFYFIVVVWGERYVDELLNFCIPSLLAPGNLPALQGRASKMVVVTTREDWERMNRSPILEVVRQYAEPSFLELPRRGDDESVYDHMSAGHRLGTRMAFHDRAYGILLTPDLVVADGGVRAIQQRATEGVQVVLTAALRYAEEPLFRQFEAMDLVRRDSRLGDRGRPLSITARQLARAALRSLHSETLRFEWDAPSFTPYFTGLPGSCWWRVPGEEGIIVHSSSWAPVLIDYGALAEHDETTMDHWALDGDYVYRNFGADRRFHVVQDSDEFLLVSWTPMNIGALPLGPGRLMRDSWLGDFIKGSLLRDAVLGPVSDPLKRKIFLRPVYLHAAELTEPWNAVRDRAQAILRRYLVDAPGWWRGSVMRVVGSTYRVYALLAGRWRHRGRILRMSAKALRGDRNALGYLRRRTRLYWHQLIGRRDGD